MSQVGERIAAVDGAGFTVTPFARADALSDALGFGEDGGVWVKDETGGVAGSHKARHLLVDPAPHQGRRGARPSAAGKRRLAIASCGNAALAAATLAAADQR